MAKLVVSKKPFLQRIQRLLATLLTFARSRYALNKDQAENIHSIMRLLNFYAQFQDRGKSLMGQGIKKVTVAIVQPTWKCFNV